VSPLQLDDLILWITLGIILGGRIGHVLFYTPQIVLADPLEIFMVWHGGMSFHGGDPWRARRDPAVRMPPQA